MSTRLALMTLSKSSLRRLKTCTSAHSTEPLLDGAREHIQWPLKDHLFFVLINIDVVIFLGWSFFWRMTGRIFEKRKSHFLNLVTHFYTEDDVQKVMKRRFELLCGKLLLCKYLYDFEIYLENKKKVFFSWKLKIFSKKLLASCLHTTYYLQYFIFN